MATALFEGSGLIAIKGSEMKTHKNLIILSLVLLGSLVTSLCGIDVSLPVISNLTPGQLIEVPITVTDLTGLGVISYYADIRFTEAVLNCTGVIKSGTLTSSWGAPSVNTSEDGRVTIGAYGVTPLSGQGTLLKVKFTVVGNLGQSSPLNFEVFQFNEGNPPAITQNGYAYVGEPASLDAPVVTIATDGVQITLSWAAVTGATSYYIETSSNPYTGYTQVDTTTGIIWSTTSTNKMFFRVIAVQ